VPAEQKLWYFLRNRRLNGYKFRRQEAIAPFIADFYCAEVGIVVELDGDTHADKAGYDTARTRWLAANGYEVVRFVNHYVHRELEAVLLTILRHCDDRKVARVIYGRTPHPGPLP
jgi:very-short-patch-repair endonuclease